MFEFLFEPVQSIFATHDLAIELLVAQVKERVRALMDEGRRRRGERP